MQTVAVRAPEATGTGPKESVLVALVLGISALTYIATLNYSFVYDDYVVVVNNPLVHSWSYLPTLLAGKAWVEAGGHTAAGLVNYYRPGFMIWSLLNYSLFGTHAWGYHLLTVLVFLADVAVLYLIVRQLTGSVRTAALASAIFGVHPVHVEAVAWFNGGEPLYCLPFFVGFYAYLRAREGNAAKWMALSSVCFVLGLLCKEFTAMLPVLIFLHLWLFGEPGGSTGAAKLARACLWMIPFAVISAVYLVIRVRVLQGFGHHHIDLPIATMAMTWPSLWWFYLKKLVLPIGLSGFYDATYYDHFDVVHVLLPSLALIAFAAGIWYWGRKAQNPLIPFCGLWMIVPFFPLLDLAIFNRGDILHDHYLFLPSVGFIILVALALEKVAAPTGDPTAWPKPLVVVTVVLIGVLCLGTAYASSFWENNLTAFSRGVQIAPHSVLARNNLANELLERKKFDDARAQYKEVLKQNPSYWLSMYNLGYLEYRAGNYADAERYFLKSADMNANDSDTFLYMGLAMYKNGEIADAISAVRYAIQLSPEKQGYHFALGYMRQQQGQCDAARAEFQQELRFNPGSTTAQQQMNAPCPTPAK